MLPLVSSAPSAVVQIPGVASAGFEQHLRGPAFEKENLVKTFLAHIVSVAVKKYLDLTSPLLFQAGDTVYILHEPKDVQGYKQAAGL